MPRSKKTMKTKRRGKKNYRRPRKQMKIVQKPYTRISKQPVAERYFTQLRYCENLSFAVSAPNTLYVYQYRSGLFDPDVTGTGHQPLYRDTFASLYNRYRVYGIKYYATAKSGTAIDLTSMFIRHNSDSTTETNQYVLRERQDGKSKVFGGPQAQPARLKGYMSVPKVFGISKQEFIGDDQFQSLVSTDPAKLGYLQFYVTTTGGSTVIYVQIDLIFYVEFFDRVDVPMS